MTDPAILSTLSATPRAELVDAMASEEISDRRAVPSATPPDASRPTAADAVHATAPTTLFNHRATSPADAMAPEEISGPGQYSPHATAPAELAARSSWIRGADIADALGLTKKTVHARALREKWEIRARGNRWEYQPPDDVAHLVLAFQASTPNQNAIGDLSEGAREGRRKSVSVRFPDLAHSSRAREVVLLREQAVQLSKIIGAVETVARFALSSLSDGSPFHISHRSLQRWQADHAEFGLDGLVDQKRGRVGKKPAASQLTPEEVFKGRALALDHGIKGRPNIARAARLLAADPQLSAGARLHLHGAHASKSYVTPSIREALATDPFTADLIQTGPGRARLNSRWTPCDHSEVRAGQAITADDMTANCYVWAEWPNERGFIVIRPQILAVLDIGSLAWTNIRAIIRARGQYTRDDVWGVTGDFFDQFGLPEIVVFEGGIWRSNVVVGHRTGLDDESRFGGLRSLGIRLIHSHHPRTKPIEQAFNQLQHAGDAVRGYSGREEKRDRPEHLERQLTLCAQGRAHPREFFLSLQEYSDHLARVQHELNNERQDGEVLRGQSPAQKWAGDNPSLRQFPDSAKWLYRSTYSIETVTRNGITVTVRSGKYRDVHHFDNPELLTKLTGRRVAVYWNDHNPEADAVILDVERGKPSSFLGIARAVKRLGRFSATAEELSEEAKRKATAMRYAVSQSRTLAPYLQRPSANLVRLPQEAAAVGEQIQSARDRAEAIQDERRREAQRVRSLGPAAAAELFGGTPDQDAESTARGATAAEELLSALTSRDHDNRDIDSAPTD